MSDLSADECQKRIEQFSEITQTDEALAQFYLQDRDWNVEASVTAFYSNNASTSKKLERNETRDSTEVQQVSKRAKIENETFLPDKISFISWNIDGINDRNLKERTMSVTQTIKIRKVDIIFLQEVVSKSYDIIRSELDSEYLITENKTPSGMTPTLWIDWNDEKNLGIRHSGMNKQVSEKFYFTVILIRRATLTLESIIVKPFSNSKMMRDLSIVDVRLINGIKLLLINTHLESGKNFAEPRMEQMKQAIDIAKTKDSDFSVLFAGDLNIRDSEVEKLGIPNSIQDLWISLGQRKECQYTWDTMRNSNTEVAGRFKPRCRFDRAYFRSSTKKNIVPEHFGLCGIEKVSGTQCFPSDHWGLYCIFDIIN